MRSRRPTIRCFVQEQNSAEIQLPLVFPLPLLEREANAQSAVDATDNFALPPEHSWIAAEEVAQSTCGHRVDDRADEADKSEQDSKKCELRDHEAFLRHNKLG